MAHWPHLPASSYRIPHRPGSELVSGVLSGSTGSVLWDAALGGGVGYLLAPAHAKLGITLAGAALAGLGGVLGLSLLVGYTVFSKR